MTSRIHLMSDHLALSSVADVARQTFGRMGDWVPQVDHAVVAFLLFPGQLPPLGIVHRLVAQGPVLNSSVTGNARHSVGSWHEPIGRNILRNRKGVTIHAGTFLQILDLQPVDDLLSPLPRQQQEPRTVFMPLVLRVPPLG